MTAAPRAERGGTCRPAVSVVLATHRGAGTIATALRSLAVQTLAADRFEVVVVQNGPRDGTEAVLAEVARAHPGLGLRRLRLGTAGAGRARNAGMAVARGDYVTFVDDDDTVSPRYLEALLAASAPDTVGVAYMAEVAEPGGAPDFGARRLVPQLLGAGKAVAPEDLFVALTYTVGKMLPTPLARAVGFDADLRGAEDMDFYARFFVQFPLGLRLCPIDAYAIYYRVLVANSLARQELSREFSVLQRLDLAERLDRAVATAPWHRRLLDHMTQTQFRLMNQFLREQPDQHADVLAEIRRRGLTMVPYGILNAGIARRLEIAYVAPPTAHPAAALVAQRVHEAAAPVDVIAADLRGTVPVDAETGSAWRPFLDQVARVRGPAPLEPDWPAAAAFCAGGMEIVREREEAKGGYESIRSHGLAPAHLLAAWYKARNPAVRWTAELGRPYDAKPGAAGPAECELLADLRGALAAAGAAAPEDVDLQIWARALVLALADRIVTAPEGAPGS